MTIETGSTILVRRDYITDGKGNDKEDVSHANEIMTTILKTIQLSEGKRKQFQKETNEFQQKLTEQICQDMERNRLEISKKLDEHQHNTEGKLDTLKLKFQKKIDTIEKEMFRFYHQS